MRVAEGACSDPIDELGRIQLDRFAVIIGEAFQLDGLFRFLPGDDRPESPALAVARPTLPKNRTGSQKGILVETSLIAHEKNPARTKIEIQKNPIRVPQKRIMAKASLISSTMGERSEGEERRECLR